MVRGSTALLWTAAQRRPASLFSCSADGRSSISSKLNILSDVLHIFSHFLRLSFSPSSTIPSHSLARRPPLWKGEARKEKEKKDPGRTGAEKRLSSYAESRRLSRGRWANLRPAIAPGRPSNASPSSTLFQSLPPAKPTGSKVVPRTALALIPLAAATSTSLVFPLCGQENTFD